MTKIHTSEISKYPDDIETSAPSLDGNSIVTVSLPRISKHTGKPVQMCGFASLKKNNPERFAELIRKGGASIPASKRSFSANPELAREAGRKGGKARKIVKDDQ